MLADVLEATIKKMQMIVVKLVLFILVLRGFVFSSLVTRFDFSVNQQKYSLYVGQRIVHENGDASCNSLENITYRSTRAPAPLTSASTSLSDAMLVSPGAVIASVPWAAP